MLQQTAPTTDAPPRNLRSAPLAAAMLGFFVVALDAQIVNVALPGLGGELGGGLSGLQWVVTGYTLTFSSLLIFGGTLSDRLGARRTYGVGMGVFVLASVACGLAPSLGVLVAARVAQGVGAALITPTSLALIREAYADGRQRARAVAYWALGGSVAAAAGPILGVPVGVGGSFTVPPLTSLLLDAVPDPRAGTASGVLNTARQVGGSLGVAVSGAVIAHLAGFMDGLRVSLLGLAVLVTVTAALSLLLPSHRTDDAR
jgi:MFS family permease